MPGARRPERVARHDRDLLLAQQALGELVRGQAGGRDVREGVEGAARLERGQAGGVEPVDEQPPSAVVLGDHRLHRRLAGLERRQRRVLGDRRRGHDPVLVDLDEALEDRGGRAHPADPPAGHRVGLGEAAHQDRPLAHARQRAERAVAVRAVREPVVDLVAVHEQVVALRDPGELVLDRVVEHGAGRVGRVAEEQRLRARGDRGLDGGGVEGEVVRGGGRDVADDAAREHDRGDVGDVRRLVEHDLVARVAGRAQGEVDGLGRADRDQDLGRRVVPDAVQPLEMRGQGPPELDGAEVRGVVGPALAQALDARLDDLARGVEVGLPHPEADDVVHRREDVEEAADARRRHHADALGERALGEGGPGGLEVGHRGRKGTRGSGRRQRVDGGRPGACGALGGRGQGRVVEQRQVARLDRPPRLRRP